MLFGVIAVATDLEKLRNQAQKQKQQGNYLVAENIYLQILKEDTTKADVIAYLQLLLRNKNYTRAKLFIEQDYVKYSKDKSIIVFSENIRKLDQFISYDSDALKLKYLNINTKADDKVLTYYTNGFLFAKSNKKKLNYTKDFSFTNLDVNFQEKKPFKFIDNQNRKLSSASFHAASRTLYYEASYSDKLSKTKKGYQHSGIFYAKIDAYNDKWFEFNSLSINSAQYTVMQPSINKTGEKLYFVSDMPGGYGGLDIYYTEYNNFTWSKPVNLGQDINTAFDEVYPFIFEDSILYYSTEGRAGLGGYDIFEVNLNDKNKESINIGAPFNTNADDFGIKKHPKLSYGFFNSNRIYNSKNDLNIYQFNLNKQVAKYIPIKVLDTINKTNVNNVKLTVYTDRTKDVSFYLLTNGYTNELKFEANELYRLSTTSPGYEDYSELIRISKNQNDIKLFVTALNNSSKNVKSNVLSISCNASGQITDFNTKRALKEVKVLLIDLRDNSIVDSVLTNENGKYFFKNLIPNNVYSISYLKAGYETNGKYITSPTIDKIIVEPHMANIVTNFVMYEKVVENIIVNNNEISKPIRNKPTINKPIKNTTEIIKSEIAKPEISNAISSNQNIIPVVKTRVEKSNQIKTNISNKIYFKRDKYQIDEQKKLELDKYLETINLYPNSKVVIISHTDAFGDAEYNRKLSIRRANEIANYFMNNGVNQNRIFAWGKGETQPLFICDEQNRCSNQQIIANRRTEIKIIVKK